MADSIFENHHKMEDAVSRSGEVGPPALPTLARHIHVLRARTVVGPIRRRATIWNRQFPVGRHLAGIGRAANRRIAVAGVIISTATAAHAAKHK